MTPVAPHLRGFLIDHLERERGASMHTRDAYAYTFKLLLTFAAGRLRTTPAALSLEQLDAALIAAFLDHLETERHNTARSRNARLAAVKSFARYLEHRIPSLLDHVRSVLGLRMKKTDERLVGYLTRVELQAVLDAPNPSGRAGLRDRAMLHLAFAAGLRVSELVGLRLDELTFETSAIVRVRGKGRRERVLPLWKQTSTTLRAWLAVRGPSGCAELFLNARGAPMTRAGFAYILSKHVRAASRAQPTLATKRVSPHVLRHTCAMHTLQATHDVRKVALWLGHSSVQTTEVYVRADPTEKLDALESALPPTLRPGRFRAPDELLRSLTPVPAPDVMRSPARARTPGPLDPLEPFA